MNVSLFFWLLPTLLSLLILLGISHYEWAWKRRYVLAEVSLGLLLAGFPFLFTVDLPWLLLTLLCLMGLWVVLLASRLMFGRLGSEFLRKSTQLNTVLVLWVFVVALDAWWALQALQLAGVPYAKLLILALLVSTVLGLAFLYQVFWTLKHYRLRKLDHGLRPRDLPTVTLAIPARNETHALETNLRAAVASEYPKLEIIVLDDCSQDKTSEIIRSFANHGVRFVQGSVPAEGWLGKNQAMRTLAEHASGDYIIFADVDTYLSPQSITKLVAYALSNKQEMVTVLPTRRDGWGAATLLTTLRYYWQIALPVTARRVPVASQAWLIRSKTLAKLGSFDAVRQKIVPEAYFARILFVHDQYRFIISNDELGVTTAKKWDSQIETAIRFLYPTLKRQPLFVLLAALALVCVFIMPFATLLVSPHDPQLLVPSIVACSVLWLGYVLVIVRTHQFTWPMTLLLMPVSLVQELVLLIVSMLAYEFGDVNWKGRNVCYPVISKPPGH
jgi:glycosyltransferase involved in cell wall biosynthesis